MPVTREFRELMQKRIAADPAFGDALLCEIIDAIVAGHIETTKAVLGMAA